jgi:membrane protein required for colicin V production
VSAWNWLDWALIAIVVVSALMAAMKGFVRELISLAAVLVGLALAAAEYQRAAAWFEDLTRSHDVALAAGFLSLFLVAMIVGALVSVLAKKMIKTAGLQSFDRFLGVGFGIIRGVVVNCILLMALVAFAIKPEVVRQSVLAPYFTAGSRGLAHVMPRDLSNQFKAEFEKFRQALIQKDKKTTKD